MANTLIYSTVTNGDLLLFGNTLGLSKASNTLTPGTLGSIGTFITMDSTKTAPGGWGPNTTLLWQENSSNAIVSLDPGDSIIKAYLFWGGSYSVTGSNLTSVISTYPVTLVNPSGVATSVAPDATKLNTNIYFEGATVSFYSNYADVTSLATIPGEYICEGVPATLSATENFYNAAGWNLAIITANSTKPYYIISIVHSNDSAGSGGYSVPIITPKTGTVTGYFTSSALDGDMIRGESMYIGPYLSGPTNPIGNFFNSQIQNGNGGSIDTTGLYGNLNPVLATYSNVVGGRQGFDTVRIPYPAGVPAGATTINGDILYTYETPAVPDDVEVLMYGFQFLASNATPTLNKTVDLGVATAGTTLTYTLVTHLAGSSTVGNVTIQDPTPTGATFVTGSVIQDGVSKPAVNLNSGLSLGTITLPYTTTITYEVTINNTTTLPVTNDYIVTYTNALSNNTIFTNTIVSNFAVTTIPSMPRLSTTKTVDFNYAAINDVLTYTVNFTNSGLDTATNVIFIDTLPTYTSLIPNSVTINGVTSGISGNPLSITLPDLSVGGTDTISFKVQVVTLPTPNPITNIANTIYSYTNPTGAGTLSSLSNVVATTIVNAQLNATKSVSETSGFVGDIVTYTVVITNSGDITANNILFIDTIPNQTTFIPNSFTINGVVQSGVSPAPPGTAIPDIGANGVTTITFNVTIDTIPTPNPTTNTSTTGYSFTSPTSAIVNSTTNSNTVSTFVSQYSTPLKAVNENFGKVGDILTYTISYINNSPTTLTSVTFFDTIPNGTTFLGGSITINGVATSGTVAPPTGITLPDLAPNTTSTIVFQVTVNTLPTPNPIPNSGFFEFSHSGTTTVASIYSNTVTTEINEAIISPVSKTLDKVFATLGDLVTYTINLYNSGNSTALNVVISDTIPNGTTFVTDSITLNGVTQTGTTIDPPTGFTIGTIPAGQTATVAFQVTVVSIPTPNPTPNTATTTYDYVLYSATGILGSGSNNTNTVNTMIYIADVTSPVKSVDKAYTAIPATLTYTITMVNTGNATALNLMFSDTIPTDTTFVPNSVTLNGVTQSGAVVSPPGFMVGTLAAGATATVTFQVTVTTIPTPNPILNSGTTNYSYIINPITSLTGTGSGNTNTASTSVNYADLSRTSKSVNSDYVTCGDILTYTITIPNNGNVSAFNIFLKDTIPSGTVLVPNSLVVNGVTQVGGDPSVGVTIPSIASGAVATLSFKVQVKC